MHAHHSIFCITPPHMLQEIIRNGSSTQRDLALQTIITSEQMRGQRRAMKSMAAFMVKAASTGNKQRAIYDAKNGAQLPGTLVRSEGDPASTDPAINEAYDGSGVTYDLFFDTYGRNSIDNNGLKLDSTVHYQKGYDNAFWDGKQMVYGDGDEDQPIAERLFNRFTIALDVIGHELTHGVTQYEANLAYWDQSGALNESLSDVFGSLVKQYQRKQTADQADWIIGEGLFTSNVNGVGIRSMKAPGTAYNDPVLGKDPQPAHMKDYVRTVEDNGGVHINSGIPNHAFYITALELGGNAWEKAGRIWYKTLTDKLQERSTFQQACDLTFEAAGEIFGTNSLEQQAVKKGWSEVGITVGGGGAETPSGCLSTVLNAFGIKISAVK
ncbi:MAG: M4 family metallopeptidase [Anaerolineales bacterium]|nr:M4 family metallopeptidase [Anaerolineales bacterium]